MIEWDVSAGSDPTGSAGAAVFDRVGGVPVGGPEVIAMAGPCSVESPEQVAIVARSVAASGARVLRGGAFKPRTSPYAFQGLGEAGLRILADVREQTGLPIVTEVVDANDVELVASYADMLQVGTRNAQNFALLQAVGAAGNLQASPARHSACRRSTRRRRPTAGPCGRR